MPLTSADAALPDWPARNVETVSEGKMPKMGKPNGLRYRTALLHTLAHAESVAIDVMWDAAGRFAPVVAAACGEAAAREFADDFLQAAAGMRSATQPLE